jgi:hypothetical protein
MMYPIAIWLALSGCVMSATHGDAFGALACVLAFGLATRAAEMDRL